MPDKKFYKGIDITYLPETTVSLMKELTDEELEKNKEAIILENHAWSLVQGFDEKTAIYLETAVLTGHHFEEYKDEIDEKYIAEQIMYLRNFYEGEGFIVDYDKMIEYIKKGRESYHVLND